MIYIWLQSIVILSLVFGGGLWLGGSLSKWTEKPAAQQAQPQVAAAGDDAFPAYHGFAPPPAPAPTPAPEPETVPLPFVAEPPPPPPVPMPAKRWALLYPVNQFGTISVTRARA